MPEDCVNITDFGCTGAEPIMSNWEAWGVILVIVCVIAAYAYYMDNF